MKEYLSSLMLGFNQKYLRSKIKQQVIIYK